MTLEAPYIAKNAKPGQFIQVRCSNGLDPLLRRPFSIHRLKAQGSRLKGIEILYEVLGKGTELLAGKKKGESLNVLGPLGNGFTMPSAFSLQPSAILVAGGIGVAPLIFLAEKLKEIRIMVLLGARTKNLILCEKDFKKATPEVYVSTDDGTYGSQGFVSKLFHKILKTTESKFETIVYVCGPHGMLKCIADICQERKFKCQVSLEEKMACGIGVCLGCAVKTKSGTKLACKDGPIFNASELIWP